MNVQGSEHTNKQMDSKGDSRGEPSSPCCAASELKETMSFDVDADGASALRSALGLDAASGRMSVSQKTTTSKDEVKPESPGEKKPEKQAKKRRTRKKVPADRPKRPLSAYNLFFHDERKNLLLSNDGAAEQVGFSSMAKLVAAKWNALDPVTRAWYEQGAEQEKLKYFVRMSEWKQTKQQKEEANTTVINPVSLVEMQGLPPCRPCLVDVEGRGNYQTIFPRSDPTMDRILVTIDELRTSLDKDFVDFMTSLDFQQTS